MKFSVNMLFSCILYCDAGPGCSIRTVCKFSMSVLITRKTYDILFTLLSTICYREHIDQSSTPFLG